MDGNVEADQEQVNCYLEQSYEAVAPSSDIAREWIGVYFWEHKQVVGENTNWYLIENA